MVSGGFRCFLPSLALSSCLSVFSILGTFFWLLSFFRVVSLSRPPMYRSVRLRRSSRRRGRTRPSSDLFGRHHRKARGKFAREKTPCTRVDSISSPLPPLSLPPPLSLACSRGAREGGRKGDNEWQGAASAASVSCFFAFVIFASFFFMFFFFVLAIPLEGSWRRWGWLLLCRVGSGGR